MTPCLLNTLIKRILAINTETLFITRFIVSNTNTAPISTSQFAFADDERFMILQLHWKLHLTLAGDFFAKRLMKTDREYGRLGFQGKSDTDPPDRLNGRDDGQTKGGMG